MSQATGQRKNDNGSNWGLSWSRTSAVVLLDVMVLVELFVAMYFAGTHRQDFTLIFLCVFFGLAVPTFMLWRLAVRKFLSSGFAEGEE